MRIVNQNRTRSYYFLDTDVLVSGISVCITRRDKIIVLGDYASEDRAMEVFSKIHEWYAEEYASHHEMTGNPIFYMPRE